MKPGLAEAKERSLAVRSSVVETGGERVGVISIHHLHPTRNRAVSVDVLNAIVELDRAGIDALVLDLRGNAGGALREVVDLAGLFLGPAPVMQIREAGGRITVESSDVKRRWDGPLVVLIDRATAAGAEMLAAALQDHGRAILVGEHTFGSGTIQNPIDLDLGSGEPRRYGWLSLTIAEVFRLNGHPLDGVGVAPDQALSLKATPGQVIPHVAASDAIAPAKGFQPVPRLAAVTGPEAQPLGGGGDQEGTGDKAINRAVAILRGLADSEPDVPSAGSTNESRQQR